MICYEAIVTCFCRILKSIEFSGGEDSSSSSQDNKPKTLEMLLLEKNRALQNENTQLKLNNSDVTGREKCVSLLVLNNLVHPNSFMLS